MTFKCIIYLSKIAFSTVKTNYPCYHHYFYKKTLVSLINYDVDQYKLKLTKMYISVIEVAFNACMVFNEHFVFYVLHELWCLDFSCFENHFSSSHQRDRFQTSISVFYFFFILDDSQG